MCRDEAQLCAHVGALLQENPLVMVEEYLPGEEGTVTVMPPSKDEGIARRGAAPTAGLKSMSESPGIRMGRGSED